jgi:hypothetical protein
VGGWVPGVSLLAAGGWVGGNRGFSQLLRCGLAKKPNLGADQALVGRSRVRSVEAKDTGAQPACTNAKRRTSLDSLQ